MTVPVKTAAGPINVTAFATCIAGAGTWAAWPQDGDPWQLSAFAGLLALTTGAAAVKTLALVGHDYRLRRNLARAQIVTSDHGSAREASWDEIVGRGMDKPGSGNFLGLFEGRYPVFAPPKTPFSLVEMPPGGGKTVCYVTGSIFHQAQLIHQPHGGASLFVPDVKLELAPMTVPGLRRRGFEVWCVNPTEQHLDTCGAVELHPYQAVLDACYAEDDHRQDTIKTAQDLAELHLPETGEEKNLYFRNGSRRCLAFAILSNAVVDPGRCTPTDAFILLNDPQRFVNRLHFVRDHLEGVILDDPVVDFLKSEAANLLHRYEKNEENFGTFLEGATQTLLTFSQGGRLAGYGRHAIHNVQELRDRQIVLFVLSPLSHTRDFAPLVSLLNYNVLAACKSRPVGRRVHVVGEEALNYRIADIVSDLETMRGLGVSADFYIQSFSGLVRKYGKDSAASIDAYADVKIYAGLNSYERAKHVSDMLSEATIRKQDYSSQSVARELNVSSRELGRRLMQPDEILAMPRDQAWVFVKGLRPMRLTMAHYGQVDPWRDWVSDNPIEGGHLSGDPLFRIRYPERTDE